MNLCQTAICPACNRIWISATGIKQGTLCACTATLQIHANAPRCQDPGPEIQDLRAWRKHRGWTQTFLAQRIGKTGSWVKGLEQGRITPTLRDYRTVHHTVTAPFDR